MNIHVFPGLLQGARGTRNIPILLYSDALPPSVALERMPLERIASEALAPP
jgi:hypothetical protein